MHITIINSLSLGTENRPCEDTVRRLLSASQKERPQQEPPFRQHDLRLPDSRLVSECIPAVSTSSVVSVVKPVPFVGDGGRPAGEF